MREQLQARLEGLKQEFEAGQARLRELEAQEARLRETMLRISGAIQVLEEELSRTESGPGEGGGDAPAI
jgi:predicted nuclease with TOPRIM domain